jgi:5'-3' exonuclease
MGIKKLNSLLQQLNLVIEYDKIEEVVYFLKKHNKSDYIFIAIDTSLYLHKYIRACNGNDQINFISLFKKQIIKLLNNNIIPIYVFDGLADDIKYETTVKHRVDQKNNYLIKLSELHNVKLSELTNDQLIDHQTKIKKISAQTINVSSGEINELKILFDTCNIPYIISPTEADIMCAKLVQDNIATACLSEDMDIIIYGCKILIKHHNGKYYIYQYDDILKKLNINSKQLCMFASLLGCDYSRSVNTKIKPFELLEICIKNDFDMFKILKDTINNDIHRKYFNESIDTYNFSLSEITNNIVSKNKYSDEELINKMCKYYLLSNELLVFYHDNIGYELINDSFIKNIVLDDINLPYLHKTIIHLIK